MGAVTQEITGSTRVKAVKLSDGRGIPADLMVMAAGIRPNIELARKAGLHCEEEVVVSDSLQTFGTRIYAVGERTQHRGQTYDLVVSSFEQTKVAANHLGQIGNASYKGSVISAKLEVNGIDLFSAGGYVDNETAQDIVVQDSTCDIYKKLVIKDNRIQDAVLYGNTLDSSWYLQLMRDGTSITDMHDQILFGQGLPG